MTNLDDLPVDILHEIHLFSLSEHLPLLNRYLYAALSRPTATRAARWLIRKYYDGGSSLQRGQQQQRQQQQRDSRWLCKALECGVCDLEVLCELERIWRDEEGDGGEDDAAVSASGLHSPRTRSLSRPPLQCPLLPKRIFRHRRTPPVAPPPPPPGPATPVPRIDPLLRHLFNHYTPNPNSHRGYPLSRAVLHGDTQLIEYLLRRGADPREKDFLAVQIGVSRRDVGVVRLLVDGPVGEEAGEEEDDDDDDEHQEEDDHQEEQGGGSGGEEIHPDHRAIIPGSNRKRRADEDSGTGMNKRRSRQRRVSTGTGSSSGGDGTSTPNTSTPNTSTSTSTSTSTRNPSNSTTRSRSSTTTTTARPTTNKFPGVRLTQPLVDSVVARGSPEMIQFIIQERGKRVPGRLPSPCQPLVVQVCADAFFLCVCVWVGG
ncbi:hypothetical protein QFC24_005874 [Naganishia onofrii]|uniref:Uncharacterized protein n=1 Tax=Naganishia onofrii TaxID=1851511 RepID=A0ACC2X5H9_9TREE|nr:hypothetical protein QFC24_005874 [Naganishia onofrii]